MSTTKLLYDGEEYRIYDYWVTTTLVTDRQMDRDFITNIKDKSMRIHQFVAGNEVSIPTDDSFTIRRDVSHENWTQDSVHDERVDLWGVQEQKGKNHHGSDSDLTAYRGFEKTFADKYESEASAIVRNEYGKQSFFPEQGYNHCWTYGEVK